MVLNVFQNSDGTANKVPRFIRTAPYNNAIMGPDVAETDAQQCQYPEGPHLTPMLCIYETTSCSQSTL